MGSTFLSRILIKRFVVPLSLTLAAAFYALFPFSGGEDVNNATQNFQSSERNNFWGGLAPWFYSLFPDSIFGSDILYAFFYLLLIGIGTGLFQKYLCKIYTENLERKLLSLLFLNYLAALFALQFSRDGSLLAFIWASFGLASYALVAERTTKLWILSALFYAIGMTFRPWLGLIVVPLILIIMIQSQNLKNKTFKSYFLLSGLALALILAPVTLDRSAMRIFQMEEAFPQQQVMIMDASAVACWSSNHNTSNQALKTLQFLAASPNLDKADLCSFFHPQTWASVVFYKSPEVKEPNPIRMIGAGESDLYNSFLKSWLQLVFSNPKDVLQSKIMLTSQFFLAGDSSPKATSYIQDVLTFPLTLTRELRLFSFLPFMFLFFLISYLRRKSTRLVENLIVLAFYLFGFLSISIAFIGDNQRYLIPISLLTLKLLLLGGKQSSRLNTD